jgi:type I site-specific restriction-modification system R (restriction) subunit
VCWSSWVFKRCTCLKIFTNSAYGNILDFRSQQSAVDEAIALFSGETSSEQSREIWLVESASETIIKLKDATQQLADFLEMSSFLLCGRSLFVYFWSFIRV